MKKVVGQIKLQVPAGKAEGDEVHLVYPGHKDPAYASPTEFLIAKLKGAKP